MKYRREIDGLRALAVLPVILYHAGFSLFRSGFVGVDIFFVISGYLITSIILDDLEQNRFSIVRFYERRARRILPALFLVIAISSIPASQWMLPDELKNFGESVVATVLFSNNILLAATTGYWQMTSEFKPLLHTWSLGVEEQYYIFFPLLLIFCWAFLRKRIATIFGALAALSFMAACWGAYHFQKTSYYILPTRAWEILAGALAAYYLVHHRKLRIDKWMLHALSGAGLLLVILGIFLPATDLAKSQIYTVIPVFGAVLIILFASEETIPAKILGNKAMVGIGLMSYSCYLWHQPLFAFARIYCRNQPSQWIFSLLSLLTLAISYLSWRFVERPFRDRKKTSRKVVFSFALAGSIILISFGIYLNSSYGMLSRLYDLRRAPISVMDKRAYNSRVFKFKKDQFTDPQKLGILVIGNSFGRDFVNMTTETFDVHRDEIVYRDDLSQCIFPFKSPAEEALYGNAKVIVFAGWDPRTNCIQDNIEFSRKHNKEIFYIGSKQFGYNLNWLIRLKRNQLPNQCNQLLPKMADEENRMAAMVPSANYISLLAPTVRDNCIPITDENGFLISTDRDHITKFGAIFFGRNVLMHSRYGDILARANTIDAGL